MCTLRHLTSKHREVSSVQKEMRDLGGLELALHQMGLSWQRNKGEISWALVKASCGLVRNLAADEENHDQLVRHKVIPRLGQVLALAAKEDRKVRSTVFLLEAEDMLLLDPNPFIVVDRGRVVRGIGNDVMPLRLLLLRLQLSAPPYTVYPIVSFLLSSTLRPCPLRPLPLRPPPPAPSPPDSLATPSTARPPFRRAARPRWWAGWTSTTSRRPPSAPLPSSQGHPSSTRRR